jgi:hypothetical protein
VGKVSFGNEDGFPGERDPDALEHHLEDENQVTVSLDQGEHVTR